jgi:hypothetical protein
MKGLKLIRRMESAGLLKPFPEEGKPAIAIEGERLRRYWTAPVHTWQGDWVYTQDTPDDPVTFIQSRKHLEVMAE